MWACLVFGVFQGKNIPLIVPALDCSDAGSALGTSKARRLTFLAPLQQLFRYALKKKLVKKNWQVGSAGALASWCNTI